MKVLAIEHLFMELLDEGMAAGELWRIVRSVRVIVEAGEEIRHQSVSMVGLARELTVELLGEGPERQEDDES